MIGLQMVVPCQWAHMLKMYNTNMDPELDPDLELTPPKK